MHEAPTDRTRVRRKRDRGRYDQAAVHAVLDAGFLCHVGFAVDGRPWVFPTIYARVDDHLYLHGARANFALGVLAAGTEACVTVTLVDAVVLARAAFNHSLNYRSVMLFGRAEAVEDEEEKRRAVTAVVEHVVPGRAADTRPPSASELRATAVVRFPLDEGSAKVRTGPPGEDPSDIGLSHWAGQLPLALAPGEAVPDVQAPGDASLPCPDYLTEWASRRPR
ncbi:MAG: pyridoxamine 5'-phosphate oxidase family protein [Acidimicrobiales bacterium]